MNLRVFYLTRRGLSDGYEVLLRFHEMEEVEDTADNQSGETATEQRLRKGAVEVAAIFI